MLHVLDKKLLSNYFHTKFNEFLLFWINSQITSFWKKSVFEADMTLSVFGLVFRWFTILCPVFQFSEFHFFQKTISKFIYGNFYLFSFALSKIFIFLFVGRYCKTMFGSHYLICKRNSHSKFIKFDKEFLKRVIDFDALILLEQTLLNLFSFLFFSNFSRFFFFQNFLTALRNS